MRHHSELRYRTCLTIILPLEDSNVAVFGCGAIGLGIIATSALVGASRIIAVDTNPGKESWAKKFGAHEFVNPTQLPEGKRIQDYLVEITDGGLDFTFDATGNVCDAYMRSWIVGMTEHIILP